MIVEKLIVTVMYNSITMIRLDIIKVNSENLPISFKGSKDHLHQNSFHNRFHFTTKNIGSSD